MPVVIDENYQPGDLVDVRSARPRWWPGVVRWVSDSQICVELEAPQPTANEWTGSVLRYGGGSPIGTTLVSRASEVFQNEDLKHIRRRV